MWRDHTTWYQYTRKTGLHWKGIVYVDPMLPFGLRFAHKIFNAIADVLKWILKQQGVRYYEHYLDDYPN